VHKRRNERFAANCIQEADKFGGGSVMMWGAISETGRTELVHVNGTLTAKRYRDEILQHHVVPIMQNNGRLFQHEATYNKGENCLSTEQQHPDTSLH
jgi:hypothetical protein